MKTRIDKGFGEALASFRQREKRETSRRIVGSFELGETRPQSVKDLVNRDFIGRKRCQISRRRVMNSPTRCTTPAREGIERKRLKTTLGVPSSRQQALQNKALDHKRPAPPERGCHGFCFPPPSTKHHQAGKTRAIHSLWST